MTRLLRTLTNILGHFAVHPSLPQTPVTLTTALRRPVNEVWFNDPRDPTQQRVILRKLVAKINAAPAGSTIQFAMYSISVSLLLDALRRAAQRGVVVLCVFDGHMRTWTGPKALATALHATGNGSRVVFSHGSARANPGGVMHAKFVLFSHNQAVAMGSSNGTSTSTDVQWSSMIYLPERPRMHAFMAEYHRQLMADTPVTGDESLDAQYGPITIRTSPRPEGMRAAGNPDVQMFRRLATLHKGGTKAKPLRGLTVRYAQHGFHSEPAVLVCKELAGMAAKGARVQVICGAGTAPRVPPMLKGCEVRSGYRPPIHIHYKFRGGSWVDARGRRRYVVGDGSENCTDTSIERADELVFLFWNNPYISQAWWRQFDKVFAWAKPITVGMTAVPDKAVEDLDDDDALGPEAASHV